MNEGVLVRDGVGARLRPGSARATAHYDLHIPTTVQGVLAARIDRLAPEEKALLQQLAVIGREFPVSLIRQVITQPEDELYRLLASLQRKEFLYEQPAFPEVEYIFKHALTQEVAYGTVLQERRKALHEQTAQAIEALYRANLGRPLQRPGASLQSQWQCRKGRGVSQPGGTASGAAVSERGRHQPPHCGSCIAQDPAGHRRPSPPRTHPPPQSRRFVDGHEGV